MSTATTKRRDNAGAIHHTIAHFAEPIDTLVAYPGNPRRGQVAAIAASLQANGQYKPITIREGTREILVGNHTWLAAKGLGWSEIAVTWVDVTDADAAIIVAVDNRTSDLGAYDDQLLADLLDRIPELDRDRTGYGADDRQALDRAAAAADRGDPQAPDEFPEYDENIPTDYRCPKCAYEWSGKPA